MEKSDHHHIHECSGECTRCHHTLPQGPTIRTCNSGMNFELMFLRDTAEGKKSDIPVEWILQHRERMQEQIEETRRNA